MTEHHPYGLISQLIAIEGKRDALVQILRDGSADMLGCLNYVVALDTTDENAIWVTELWEDETFHQASLTLPTVQEAIRLGRPLIAGFGTRHVTQPRL